MKQHVPYCAILILLGCLGSFGFARLQAEDTVSPIVAVIHIDIMPPYADAAVHLLHDFCRDSANDDGKRRIELLQQTDRPNHFTLVEEWADQKAFDAHNEAEHTRRFRDKLQPMLGSPFDERLHSVVDLE